MGKNKICNQTFIKDKFRDHSHIGTMKCMVCNEESHLSVVFGCTVTAFTKEVESFTKHHTLKGCNKERVKVTPDWACTEFDIGIA